MDGGYRIHRLQFDDDEIFNKQVNTIAEIKLDAIVNHGQTNLCQRPESRFPEFMLQTSRVSAFQQPRAQFGVNPHRRRDYGTRDLLRGDSGDRAGSHKSFYCAPGRDS